jgi:hypothetical protein
LLTYAWSCWQIAFTNQLICNVLDFSMQELYGRNKSCVLFSCACRIVGQMPLFDKKPFSLLEPPKDFGFQRRRCSKFDSQRRYSEIMSILFYMMLSQSNLLLFVMQQFFQWLRKIFVPFAYCREVI